MSALDTAVAVGHPTLRQRLGKPFFVAMSLLLIATVVLGFSPTFFFRAYFDVPTIPPFLIVHGAVLSLWFVWMLVQTSLVAAHRTELHRTASAAGSRIALALAALGWSPSIGTVLATLLMGGPIVYDFIVRGRPRFVTVVCCAWQFLMVPVTAMLAANERCEPSS